MPAVNPLVPIAVLVGIVALVGFVGAAIDRKRTKRRRWGGP